MLQVRNYAGKWSLLETSLLLVMRKCSHIIEFFKERKESFSHYTDYNCSLEKIRKYWKVERCSTTQNPHFCFLISILPVFIYVYFSVVPFSKLLNIFSNIHWKDSMHFIIAGLGVTIPKLIWINECWLCFNYLGKLYPCSNDSAIP